MITTVITTDLLTDLRQFVADCRQNELESSCLIVNGHPDPATLDAAGSAYVDICESLIRRLDKADNEEATSAYLNQPVLSERERRTMEVLKGLAICGPSPERWKRATDALKAYEKESTS